MPNNITNRLRLDGSQEEINNVFNFLKATEPNKDGKFECVDFNNIIRVPTELNGDRLIHWCIDNWGTKWNAYKTFIVPEENTLFFDTAWSGVPELMNFLASKFPNVTFYYDYADEDISYNIGTWKFKGNEGWQKSIKENTKEAFELCFELGKCDKDEFELINGNYSRKY